MLRNALAHPFFHCHTPHYVEAKDACESSRQHMKFMEDRKSVNSYLGP
jgi:hypothetical protein